MEVGRPKKISDQKSFLAAFSSVPPENTPTIAGQIGSKGRGLRLKKLAEVGRDELLAAASKLWEAGEKHWARAKDAGKLFKAIDAKIRAQAEYVVWRDSVVVPSQKSGGRISVRNSGLPESDPGTFIAHKWRKKFCSDGAVDDDKLTRVINDAQTRCLRVCEQENANTIRGTEGTGENEWFTPADWIARARGRGRAPTVGARGLRPQRRLVPPGGNA